MTAIPTERLKAAVALWEQVYGENPSGVKEGELDTENLVVQNSDFAERLIILEPWAEKAREVLRKTQFIFDEFAKVEICSSCGDFRRNGHAPDCALAELLREE